ncbi:hypothetical protein BD413DRAFT_617049 [Trametes elegans]|nr:hypothetical protein BD413DRAFT_617049 [Trametes elegans]
MNFTLDDADPSLSYSTDGWAVQRTDDADLDEFFDRTYHAAQQDGATMTFTFSGSAFALYGSKGPGHAKLQVVFDGTAVVLDASAPQSLFRQELFQHAFGPANETGQHQVKLLAVLSGDGLKGKWLDVDYITFTAGGGATSAIGTVTSTPPWLDGTSTSQPSAYRPLGTANTPYISPSSTPSRVPTILAALFGTLIGLALLTLAAYLLLRRTCAARRARERAFRYGQSSAHPSTYLSSVARPAASASSPVSPAGGAYSFAGGSAQSAFSAFAPSGSSTAPPPPLPLKDPGAYGYAFGHAHAHGGSFGGSSTPALEMRSMSVDSARRAEDVAGGPGAGAGGRVATPTRLLGSAAAAPIAWTRQKVAGKHTGDADSLRTDFLQV